MIIELLNYLIIIKIFIYEQNRGENKSNYHPGKYRDAATKEELCNVPLGNGFKNINMTQYKEEPL